MNFMSKFRVSEKDGKALSNPKRIPQDFVSAAMDFEASRTEDMRAARDFAFKVAALFAVAFFISALTAAIAVFKRPEATPTIITLDKGTGVSQIQRSVLDTFDHFDEVTDKHWLAQYVRTRESYDWFEIGTNFDVVRLMSAPSVAEEYRIRVYEKNSPLSVLKDKARLRVDITSISFIGQTAQVRYTVQKLSPSGQNTDDSPLKNWMATISYDYENRSMTEQERVMNNLGFTVLSYRNDEEVSK